MIKIGLQKGGRLSEKSLDMLQKASIKLSNGVSKLRATSTNFPIEALFLRDDDIPGYVEKGVVHIGVVGENVMIESGVNVKVTRKLGFGKCRLSLAIPKNVKYEGIEYFQGKSIATSYPNILNAELAKHNIKADVFDISGSVEVAPSLGVADAIFDIVSTGSTLTMNGLKEVAVLMESEAVLISNTEMSDEENALLDEILFRIESVSKAQENQYILLNVPNDKLQDVLDLLPGLNAPTVMPLSNRDWSSVHSVIPEKSFWQIIRGLRQAGAEGILTIPIDKMFA